ncbi:MAG: hypothetical protein ACFE0I_03145 [Elainellaceae cyanobacterium]
MRKGRSPSGFLSARSPSETEAVTRKAPSDPKDFRTPLRSVRLYLFHQPIALEISQDVSLVALNRDAANKTALPQGFSVGGLAAGWCWLHLPVA